MFKRYEDLAAFHDANLDAMLRGSEAVHRGADEMRVTLLAFMKGTKQKADTAAKAARHCRGVRDVVSLQSDLVTGLVETYLTHVRKIAEAQRKAMETTLGSLSERVVAGVEVVARSRVA